jgi:hypothetical protein
MFLNYFAKVFRYPGDMGSLKSPIYNNEVIYIIQL